MLHLCHDYGSPFCPGRLSVAIWLRHPVMAQVALFAARFEQPGHGSRAACRQQSAGEGHLVYLQIFGAFGEECRDEDRPGSQAAVQQAASPSGWPALRAGGFHGQTVASRGDEDGTPPD
jgi:hypothetical protein